MSPGGELYMALVLARETHTDIDEVLGWSCDKFDTWAAFLREEDKRNKPKTKVK